MTRLALYITLIATAIAIASCSDNDHDHDSDNIHVDPAYIDALDAHYPTASHIEWETEGPWHVAEFHVGQNELEAWFDSDARWVMTRTELNRNLLSVPTAVAEAFASGPYGTWSIDDIDFYEKEETEFYVIEVENPGREDHNLFYQTDGTLIKAIVDNGQSITPDTPV